MKLREDLLQIVGEERRISTNETVLTQHSHGISYHPGKWPDVVVFPVDKEEVRRIVRYANVHHIPIVPYGVGSSLEGQMIPERGGISIDFSLMNTIISIQPDDFLAIVQPGVTRTQLNQALKSDGLFFSVDPGADATFGGMAATNASGTNTVKYGGMRDQVLGLELVNANGEIIRTGGQAMKSSAGYDLTGLFVGSEGTLGVFTEITVRLQGIPEFESAAKATFSTIEAAANTAMEILKAGIPIGKVELVDQQSIAAVNDYKETDYRVCPTLFLELSGSKASVREAEQIVRDLANLEGCLDFEFETDSLKRAKLWEARHHLSFAVRAAHAGKQMMSTDICVPISKLPAAITNTRKLADQYKIDAAIFGHVGDGNYHCILPMDVEDQKEMEKVQQLHDELVHFALANGGTCTGEHGIGIGKRKYLYKEHPTSIPMMKVIKHSFDPNGILNPGKIFLDE